LHKQLAKGPGQIVCDHIYHVRWALARYLEDVPNSCLRIEDNWVFFLMLTLKGDPEWHYRVDELHLQARNHQPWGKYYWCNWEPMGMSMVDLISYLRLEGPYGQEHIPTASAEDVPPPGDNLTDEEGDSKDEGDASMEAGPVEEEDPEEDPNEEEMEEEDLEEDPSKAEPMEEEDPEENSDVSEGELMGSEVLEGDISKSKTDALERQNPEREEGRMKFTVEVD